MKKFIIAIAAAMLLSSVGFVPARAENVVAFTTVGSIVSTQAGGIMQSGLPRHVVAEGLGDSDRVLVSSSGIEGFSMPTASWAPTRLFGLDRTAGGKGDWNGRKFGGPSNGVVGYIPGSLGDRYSVSEVFGGGFLLRSWWLPAGQCASQTDASLSLQRVLVFDECARLIRLYTYGGASQTSTIRYDAPDASGNSLVSVDASDVSKDGKLVAVTGSNLVRVFDLRTGMLVRQLTFANPSPRVNGAAFDAANNLWTVETAIDGYPGGRLRGFDSNGTQFVEYALPEASGFNHPTSIDVSFASGRIYIGNQRNADFAHSVVALEVTINGSSGADAGSAIVDSNSSSLNGSDANVVNPANPDGQQQADSAAAPTLKAKIPTLFKVKKGKIKLKVRCPLERCTFQAVASLIAPDSTSPTGESNITMEPTKPMVKGANKAAKITVKLPKRMRTQFQTQKWHDLSLVITVSAKNRAGGVATSAKEVFGK